MIIIYGIISYQKEMSDTHLFLMILFHVCVYILLKYFEVTTRKLNYCSFWDPLRQLWGFWKSDVLSV